MAHALVMVALLWPMAHNETGPLQYVSTIGHADMAMQLAMGPDPGGHTGDTVTPSTTKTGQPVENGQAPAKSEGAGTSKGEAAKHATPPQDSASSGQGERR